MPWLRSFVRNVHAGEPAAGNFHLSFLNTHGHVGVGGNVGLFLQRGID
jgi:hypothetical protein